MPKCYCMRVCRFMVLKHRSDTTFNTITSCRRDQLLKKASRLCIYCTININSAVGVVDCHSCKTVQCSPPNELNKYDTPYVILLYSGKSVNSSPLVCIIGSCAKSRSFVSYCISPSKVERSGCYCKTITLSHRQTNTRRK